MPGWPSRLLSNPSGGPSSSRRAPSPDSLYDGDFDLPEVPGPFGVPERRGSAGAARTLGSSPPRRPGQAPRTRPHMHTGSDKAYNADNRKRQGPSDFESRSFPSSSDARLQERAAAFTRPNQGQLESRDMEAGSCATCDTRVRWPRGVNEFRCGTCLMVNDLRPVQSRSRSPRGAPLPAPGQNGSQHAQSPAGPMRCMFPPSFRPLASMLTIGQLRWLLSRLNER